MKQLRIVKYTAGELKKLKPCKWNRPVTQADVDKIYQSIVARGYDQTEIVVVDKKTMSAVDGNHRIHAFCKYIDKNNNKRYLTIPVQMVEFDSDDEMREWILRKNNLRSSWNQLDYVSINRHINDAYEKCEKIATVNPKYFYRKVGNEYLIDPTTGKPAVKYSSVTSLMFGKSQGDKIKTNRLVVTEDNMKTFYKNYVDLESIIEAVGWSQENVALRRYDMFAQVYVWFINAYDITPEQIVKTIKSKKRLREQLYNEQFTTKDGFRNWFKKIDDAFHQRRKS